MLTGLRLLASAILDGGGGGSGDDPRFIPVRSNAPFLQELLHCLRYTLDNAMVALDTASELDHVHFNDDASLSNTDTLHMPVREPAREINVINLVWIKATS